MPGLDRQEKPVKWISPRAWAVVALAAAMAWLGRAPALAETHHAPLFGIYDQCVPGNPACAARIEHALPLSLAVTYAPLMQPPPLATLKAIHRDGQMPVLVADPYGISKRHGFDHPYFIPARKIAAGHFDGYLRRYAHRLRSLRFRVGLSFGHEMNGDWYSWGRPACGSSALDEHSQGPLPPNSPGRTPPRLFVKAWRHLHDVFTRQKAWNVTWIWTVNRLLWTKGCSSPRGITRADWPGSRYVNWIGIDGYPTKHGIRFWKRLAPTVRFVRTFARKPILIQETGVWPGSSQWAQFRALVRGVRRYHLLGWVYENRDGKLGRWTLTRREERFLGRLLRRDGYGRGGRMPGRHTTGPVLIFGHRLPVLIRGYS